MRVVHAADFSKRRRKELSSRGEMWIPGGGSEQAGEGTKRTVKTQIRLHARYETVSLMLSKIKYWKTLLSKLGWPRKKLNCFKALFYCPGKKYQDTVQFKGVKLSI